MRALLQWLDGWKERRRTEDRSGGTPWVKSRWDLDYAHRKQLHESLQWDLDNTINPLPPEEAQRRGEALLSETDKWQCVKNPVSEASRLKPLAPLLRAFFERYESVQRTNGHEAMLLRDEIGPVEHPYYPELSDEFLKIGYDYRMTPFQIWVRPGEETLYIMDLEVSKEPRRSCASVYHYLLYVDRRKAL